jgi:methyl-accepting chemotaxis protein
MISIFGLLIIFVCLGLGLISFKLASNALINETKEMLPSLSVEISNTVESRINEQWNSLSVIASMNQISDMSVPFEEKKLILDKEISRSGHKDLFIAGLDGIVNGRDINISERAYFKKALLGEDSISEPVINKIDSTLSIAYAVPIQIESKVVGVLVALRDGNDLSKITNDITYGESGKAYMIGETGTFIAHTDKNNVVNMVNTIEESKSDHSLDA